VYIFYADSNFELFLYCIYIALFCSPAFWPLECK